MPVGDDELSRQREKHTTASLTAHHPSGKTDEGVKAVIGTAAVVQFPMRRWSRAREVNRARRQQVLQRLQAMLLPE